MDLLLQLQPLLLKFCDPVGLLLQRPKNLEVKAGATRKVLTRKVLTREILKVLNIKNWT